MDNAGERIRQLACRAVFEEHEITDQNPDTRQEVLNAVGDLLWVANLTGFD